MSDFTWSSEAVDILRELWGAKSASAIGDLIGTTKNSVIGKVHRMGLPRLQTGKIDVPAPRTEPHHDSAAFLEVAFAKARDDVGNETFGYVVRRSCPCHFREIVSLPFETYGQAMRCLQALHDEARKRGVA